jgi:hypothetical protein
VIHAHFAPEYFQKAYEFIMETNIHDFRATMLTLGHRESVINATIRRLQKTGLIK